MQFEITTAKIEELGKWKTYDVYDTVDNNDHKFINLRWVLREKYVNEKLIVKARLVQGSYTSLGIFFPEFLRKRTVFS